MRLQAPAETTGLTIDGVQIALDDNNAFETDDARKIEVALSHGFVENELPVVTTKKGK
jgi:hypothetical protein